MATALSITLVGVAAQRQQGHVRLRAGAPVTAPCPPVMPNQIYRFIQGQDACMAPMSQGEIQTQLNDPFATSVLRSNAGGKGTWPATVPDIVTTVGNANPGWQQNSYMVGEGCQIPITIAPREGINRDLRYVVDWGAGQSPTIFLSALPPGVPNGTPPAFLQVISWDSKKLAYNFYQYVNNSDVGTNATADTTRTWSWAGDSTFARNPVTIGQGCFDCHLNGAVIMKELTSPWNNWQSQLNSINPAVVPQAVANDPLFQNLSGAQQFEKDVEGGVFGYTLNWVRKSINKQNVTNVPELLRRLIVTTNVNFAATQVPSASHTDVTALPKDFFLYDSLLNGVLNLRYTVPTLTLKAGDYSNYIANNGFKLVNTDPPGAYQQAGDTFFAFFVPVPAFEDTKAIQQLIQQKVITPQFAAAVLMVDFQNPVFSARRSSLMQYALKITTAKTVSDPQDVPHQFAALVTAAAANQPACDPNNLAQCTAEQQFLYYWNQPASNWQNACLQQLNAYLQAIGARIGATAGANDYLTLSVARRARFAQYPLVCNLHEFSLLLPQTSLQTSPVMQMNTDGTISTLPGGSL